LISFPPHKPAFFFPPPLKSGTPPPPCPGQPISNSENFVHPLPQQEGQSTIRYFPRQGFLLPPPCDHAIANPFTEFGIEFQPLGTSFPVKRCRFFKFDTPPFSFGAKGLARWDIFFFFGSRSPFLKSSPPFPFQNVRPSSGKGFPLQKAAEHCCPLPNRFAVFSVCALSLCAIAFLATQARKAGQWTSRFFSFGLLTFPPLCRTGSRPPFFSPPDMILQGAFPFVYNFNLRGRYPFPPTRFFF